MAKSSTITTRLFTGIPVVVGPSGIVISDIIRRARDNSQRGCDVHLLEMNGVAVAHSSDALRQTLSSACMVIPDGKWLELLTKKSGVPLSQTRGEDLFRGVMAGDGGSPLRSFFLGSTPEVLGGLRETISRDYPGVMIVGEECPPFRELSDHEVSNIAQTIRSSQAQIVWIGISTPRQDFLAAELARQTPAVVIAVGAAFEFVSGHKVSAPRWMSVIGVEWLFRLITEPRRLWRRYLIGGGIFLLQVFRFRSRDL
jgi:N-acetylglucosaminyldiphosphoundecaprenol N-acetyl-beta-D-mannosaminyltransferase